MNRRATTSAGAGVPGDPLWRATAETVAARGYRATSVAHIVASAGIARSTFYARYPSKEQCFGDAVEEILRETLETVRAAIPQLGSARELLEPPIAALLQAVAEHPDAARAALIESHAAGAAADAHRRDTQALLGRMVARALGCTHGAGPLGAALATAVCGGIETLVVRTVREGAAAELPPLAGELAEWAAGYRRLLEPAAPTLPEARPRPSRRRGQAPGSLVPAGPSGRRGLPPGPKREPRETVAATVRERLLDATALVAAEQGFDGLTVATIVARAETSRRSFYEHFTSIPEAFGAALRLGAEAATAATLTAYAAQRDPARGVVAGLDRLTAFLAEEPAFAAASLLEAPAGGIAALAVRDEGLDALAGLLADAHRRLGAPPERADLVADLAAGGALALCAEHARAHDLPGARARVPVLAAIALAPTLDPPSIAAAVEATIDSG